MKPKEREDLHFRFVWFLDQPAPVDVNFVLPEESARRRVDLEFRSWSLLKCPVELSEFLVCLCTGNS
jgi:hypothetical protein